jgi:hypothetical protein
MVPAARVPEQRAAGRVLLRGAVHSGCFLLPLRASTYVMSEFRVFSDYLRIHIVRDLSLCTDLTEIPYAIPQVLRKNYGVFLSMELRARRHSPTRRHRSAACSGRHGHGQSKRHGVDSRPRSRRRGQGWHGARLPSDGVPSFRAGSRISPKRRAPSRCDAEGDPLLPTPVGSLARPLSNSFSPSRSSSPIDDRRRRCPSTTSTWP